MAAVAEELAAAVAGVGNRIAGSAGLLLRTPREMRSLPNMFCRS